MGNDPGKAPPPPQLVNQTATAISITPHELELIKIYVEYLKRLATLSTGSVLLMTAFLEKLFTRPQWKGFLIMSLVSFTVSVVAGVLGDTMLVSASASKSDFWRKPFGRLIGTVVLTATWISFLLGIAGLTAFAIKNIVALPSN